VKRCSKCAQSRPRSEFNRDRWKSDGLKSQCKECRNIARRGYRARLRAERLGRIKRYVRFRWVIARLWQRSSTRPRRLDTAGFRRWVANNEARRRAAADAIRRKVFKAHPEDAARWRHERPDRVTNQRQRRRAAVMGVAINDLTDDQWAWLIEAYDHRCAYCGHEVEALTPDHILPMARGGNNTLSNIVPACLGCNTRKQARTPEEAGMRFAVQVDVASLLEQQPLLA
jgi:5-methylcytosine-specific restriction endonuclease McrA